MSAPEKFTYEYIYSGNVNTPTGLKPLPAENATNYWLIARANLTAESFKTALNDERERINSAKIPANVVQINFVEKQTETATKKVVEKVLDTLSISITMLQNVAKFADAYNPEFKHLYDKTELKKKDKEKVDFSLD